LAPAVLAGAGCGLRGDESAADAHDTSPAPSVVAPSGSSESDRIIAAKQPYDPAVPRASLAQAARHSILEGATDSPEDPERDAYRKGYRDVTPRDLALDDPTYPSAETLAAAVLDALLFDAEDLLTELQVKRREYDEIFWPEMPASRPVTGISAGDSWAFHDAKCRDGIREGLESWGGQKLQLVGLEYRVGFTPFTNFDLYRGVVIVAVDENERQVRIPIASTFVEVGGQWKVFQYDS
ncbi:MAG: hypothetical protein KC591_08175, partial [Gemmatimonadetes bacterium]|nr:hypothetical protein [Gemmatimonadota bacterium]